MITGGSLLIKKQRGLHDQSSSRGLCQAWIFKHLREENVLRKIRLVTAKPPRVQDPRFERAVSAHKGPVTVVPWVLSYSKSEWDHR